MLLIPSLRTEAYRYLVLYSWALYFSLLFLYLPYTISRSLRSLFLYLAALRSPL